MEILTIFFDNTAGVVRVLVVGPLAYLGLILVLRITGKRTLAQPNAFDFIVTVAVGSSLASVVLTKAWPGWRAHWPWGCWPSCSWSPRGFRSAWR